MARLPRLFLLWTELLSSPEPRIPELCLHLARNLIFFAAFRALHVISSIIPPPCRESDPRREQAGPAPAPPRMRPTRGRPRLLP